MPIFEDDGLDDDPTQVIGIAHNRNWPPEKRLAFEMLSDSLHKFKALSADAQLRSSLSFLEVEAWVRSNDREWIFAFLNVCDLFEIDAGWLRKMLCDTFLKPKEGGV